MTAHRFAAIVSTVKALEATQLPAAMSYGPPAALAWIVFRLIGALRRRLTMIAG